MAKNKTKPATCITRANPARQEEIGLPLVSSFERRRRMGRARNGSNNLKPIAGAAQKTAAPVGPGSKPSSRRHLWFRLRKPLFSAPHWDPGIFGDDPGAGLGRTCRDGRLQDQEDLFRLQPVTPDRKGSG